jgi:hypothetical protein
VTENGATDASAERPTVERSDRLILRPNARFEAGLEVATRASPPPGRPVLSQPTTGRNEISLRQISVCSEISKASSTSMPG